MKWIVKEHEGYKEVNSWKIETEEEAEKFWDKKVSQNKFAGVGGKYKHYYSCPRKID